MTANLSLAPRLTVCLALSAFSLTGCVSLAPEEEQPAIIAQMPESFAQGEREGAYRPANWWVAFEDPVLDEFLDQALRSNLDIAEAVGRLEQARAQARLSRSALLPAINATGDASFSSTPVDGLAFGGIAGGAADRIENETFTASLGVGYELDLFGRVRNDYRAARQDAEASAFDLRSVQLATAAETISAYFDIVDAKRQIELTGLTIDVLSDRTSRSEERFERGLIESFELYQVRQDLRSTEASLPQLESGLAASQARLALLLGQYPQALDEALSQSLQPRLVFEPVPPGLPIDLLDQRPDVAAAALRLDAARLRIGARKAERFPSLNLSGSIGTQGGEPSAVFDTGQNWAATLASSIVAPILDGGRINANIRSARAVYDQQAAAYARTVLSAFGEVESAIADYEQQRSRYRLVSEQLETARASLDLQRRRFAGGVGDYTAYLDALRTLYQVEGSLSSAARATALARLGVHRALGGDWAADAPLPVNPMMEIDPDRRGDTP